MASQLVIQYTAEKAYVIGNDLNIGITMENSGEQNILIRKPLTSSELLRYDLFSIQKENKEVAYAGALFHSDKNTESISLPPKESLKFSVSIAKEYLLDDSGNYSLKIRADALLYDRDNTVITPSTLSFSLSIGDELPVLTHSQIAQKISKSSIKYKEFGNGHRIYNSFSNKDVANTQEAHEVAEKALKYIIKQSVYSFPFSLFFPLTFLSSFSKAYGEMFCNSKHDDWNTLVTTYSKMRDYIKEGMKYWYSGKHCDPGDYGYVFPADTDKNIYFCDEYVKAQNTPTLTKKYDSKAGVHIHEISHKAASTEDHFYSYGDCKLKASSCDLLTINNADCVQIFAELVYVDDDVVTKVDL